jgi:hypothetical protein
VLVEVPQPAPITSFLLRQGSPGASSVDTSNDVSSIKHSGPVREISLQTINSLDSSGLPGTSYDYSDDTRIVEELERRRMREMEELAREGKVTGNVASVLKQRKFGPSVNANLGSGVPNSKGSGVNSASADPQPPPPQVQIPKKVNAPSIPPRQSQQTLPTEDVKVRGPSSFSVALGQLVRSIALFLFSIFNGFRKLLLAAMRHPLKFLLGGSLLAIIIAGTLL